MHVTKNTIAAMLLLTVGVTLSGGTDFKFDRYYNLDEMYEFIATRAAKYPELMRTKVMGKTYEGRNITLVKISSEPGNTENPIIFMDVGMHAREWLTHVTGMYLIEKLLTGYDHNSTITKMLDKFDFYIFAVLNPDGYAYTWEKPNDVEYRTWRKNRSKSKSATTTPDCPNVSTIVGVDINRNFATGWNADNSSVLTEPCSDSYRGTSPFSEAESTAVKQVVEKYGSRIKTYISLHTYGNTMIFPYGYKPDLSKDFSAQYYVAVNTVSVMDEFQEQYRRFIIGAVESTYYKATGISIDWVYEVGGIALPYTIELKPSFDDCNLLKCFEVPESQIPNVVESYLAGMIKLADVLSKSPVWTCPMV